VVKRNISPVCETCDGDCCKAINLMIKPAPLMQQLLGVHYGRDPESIEMVQVGLKHRCPHLMDNGKCELWHEDPEQDQRPEYCQMYLCDKAKNPGVLIVEVEELGNGRTTN